jgi:hypothetical protein
MRHRSVASALAAALLAASPEGLAQPETHGPIKPGAMKPGAIKPEGTKPWPMKPGAAGAERAAGDAVFKPAIGMTPAGTPARLPFPGVDTHVHLHPVNLAQVMRSGKPAARVDTASALLAAAARLVRRMDEIGIRTALVVTVPPGGKGGAANESVEQEMARVVAAHPGRLALLGGGAVLNPLIQAVPPDKVGPGELAAFRVRAEKVIAGGAKGFGEMISVHLCMTQGHNFQHASADHPLFLALAEIAAARNVAIDLHMEAIAASTPTPGGLRRACGANPESLPPSVPPLERLLAAQRGARIVWQHIGWDNVGAMTPALLQGLLERHPNLFLGLRVEARTTRMGGDGPMPNRLVDAQLKLLPEWQAFMARNSERLVIGADDFISPEEGPPVPSQSLNETWSILAQLPPEVARRIGGDNARRIYRLD